MSEQSGQTARDFGQAVGGNDNTRKRLLNADAILRAGKRKRIPVPFWQAVADGNTKTQKAVGEIVARLEKGDNPYKAATLTASGRKAKGTGTPPKGKPRVTKFADLADILRAVTPGVPKDESLTDAQWRDLDRAARAFSLAVAKRAGTATATRTRKTATAKTATATPLAATA